MSLHDNLYVLEKKKEKRKTVFVTIEKEITKADTDGNIYLKLYLTK